MIIALLGTAGQNYLIAGEVPPPVGSGHVTNVPIRALKTKDGSVEKLLTKYGPLGSPADFIEQLLKTSGL